MDGMGLTLDMGGGVLLANPHVFGVNPVLRQIGKVSLPFPWRMSWVDGWVDPHWMASRELEAFILEMVKLAA